LRFASPFIGKESWLAERGIDAVWPVRGGTPAASRQCQGVPVRGAETGCEQYGIAIDHRPVRTPHYGGHIERLIGTMMGKVHLLPGTTFSNIGRKAISIPRKVQR
jgi:putative transposase